MTFLELDDAIAIIDELAVGPVRDIGLLDSAIHRPQAAAFGELAYPTIHLQAAVLLESLSRNHPLVDGNKRLSWTAVVVFYGLNGVRLRAPHDAAYDLVIAVCTSERDYHETAAALEQWCDY